MPIARVACNKGGSRKVAQPDPQTRLGHRTEGGDEKGSHPCWDLRVRAWEDMLLPRDAFDTWIFPPQGGNQVVQPISGHIYEDRSEKARV